MVTLELVNRLLAADAKARWRVHSQGGQDMVLDEIFGAIGTTNKAAVEFGFNSDRLTGGTGANCAALCINRGFKPFLFDGDYENPAINLRKAFLTEQNIVEVFDHAGVPRAPDYLSIDVDSIDLWLLSALLWNGYRPRVISCEYNSAFPVNVSATARADCVSKRRDAYYGASLLALWLVGFEHGYIMVAVEPRMDVFFVRADLCDSDVRELRADTFAKYCGDDWKRRPTPERARSFLEWPSCKPLLQTPWGTFQ